MGKTTKKSGTSGKSGATAKAKKRIWKNKRVQQDRLIARLKHLASSLTELDCTTRFLLVVDTPGNKNTLYMCGSKAWHKWGTSKAAKLKEKGMNETNRELKTGKTASRKHTGARASQDLPAWQAQNLPDMVRDAYKDPKLGLTTSTMFQLTSAVDKGVERTKWGKNNVPGNLEAFKGKGIDLGDKQEDNKKITVDAFSLVSGGDWKDVKDIPGFPTTRQALEKSRRFVTFERLIAMTATQAKDHLYPSAQWVLVGLGLMSVRSGSTTTFSLSSENVIKS